MTTFRFVSFRFVSKATDTIATTIDSPHELAIEHFLMTKLDLALLQNRHQTLADLLLIYRRVI